MVTALLRAICVRRPLSLCACAELDLYVLRPCSIRAWICVLLSCGFDMLGFVCNILIVC